MRNEFISPESSLRGDEIIRDEFIFLSSLRKSSESRDENELPRNENQLLVFISFFRYAEK